jgi:hypothetical protein
VEARVIEAVCDCGAVRLEVAAAPGRVNDCQCSWCQRLGALWAYYSKDQVRFLSGPAASEVYRRGPERLAFHRCRVCGLTAYWVAVDASVQRMGVNARLMPREVRERAEVYQGGRTG